MKVLVLYEMYPESSHILLIDMTAEEFAFLSQANGYLVGCYSGEDTDAISKALCAWNYALIGMDKEPGEEIEMDYDAISWMEDTGVDLSWFNRFAGRITKVENITQSGSFDAFINTGFSM